MTTVPLKHQFSIPLGTSFFQEKIGLLQRAWNTICGKEQKVIFLLTYCLT